MVISSGRPGGQYQHPTTSVCHWLLADEVADLSGHERWDDERRFCRSKQFEAHFMVADPGLGGRIDRAGAEEKCYRRKPSRRRDTPALSPKR